MATAQTWGTNQELSRFVISNGGEQGNKDKLTSTKGPDSKGPDYGPL